MWGGLPHSQLSEETHGYLRNQVLYMADSLDFSSGVSVFDGSPFVLVTWGNQEGQLTPDEADAHAVKVIQVAQAARHDAAIYAELRESLGVDEKSAAGFVAALRDRLERHGG